MAYPYDDDKEDVDIDDILDTIEKDYDQDDYGYDEDYEELDFND